MLKIEKAPKPIKNWKKLRTYHFLSVAKIHGLINGKNRKIGIYVNTFKIDVLLAFRRMLVLFPSAQVFFKEVETIYQVSKK